MHVSMIFSGHCGGEGDADVNKVWFRLVPLVLLVQQPGQNKKRRQVMPAPGEASPATFWFFPHPTLPTLPTLPSIFLYFLDLPHFFLSYTSSYTSYTSYTPTVSSGRKSCKRVGLSRRTWRRPSICTQASPSSTSWLAAAANRFPSLIGP